MITSLPGGAAGNDGNPDEPESAANDARELQDLLPGLRSGDPAAGRELYERSQPAMRAYFARELPDRDAADDCASEVFERALRGFQRGREPESVGKWLRGIARHVQAKSYHDWSLRPLPFDEEIDAADAGASEYDQVGVKQALGDIREIIQAFSPVRREVMLAYYTLSIAEGREVKGLSLAQALGGDWTQARVNRELSRGLVAVREDMGVLALARGARACPGAAALLPQLTRQPGTRMNIGDITPRQRKALTAHAGDCPACKTVLGNSQKASLYALGPGLILLSAAFRPSREERERQAAAWLDDPAGSSSPSAPAMAAPAGVLPGQVLARPAAYLAHLAGHGISKARDATLAVTMRVPGLSYVAQLAQNNPMVAKIGGIGGVVALVATLFALNGSPPASHAASQPSPHATQSAPSVAPSRNAGPGAPSNALAAAQAASTTGSGSQSGGSGSQPGAAVPQPTAQAAPASQSTTPGSQSGSSPSQSTASASASASTTSASQPAQGSPGPFAVTVDVSGLSYDSVGISNVGGWDARKPVPVALLPGSYSLVLPGSPATMLPFQVTSNGTIAYDAQYDGLLTGRGTTTLGLTHHV
jgi:DNA-directed RNA polymerase specialized sigma24 family protein